MTSPLLRQLSTQEQALLVVEWHHGPVPNLNSRIYVDGTALRVVGYYLADSETGRPAIRVLTQPDSRPRARPTVH